MEQRKIEHEKEMETIEIKKYVFKEAICKLIYDAIYFEKLRSSLNDFCDCGFGDNFHSYYAILDLLGINEVSEDDIDTVNAFVWADVKSSSLNDFSSNEYFDRWTSLINSLRNQNSKSHG